MRILEGTHDLLEEVKYAIEQKLNLSDYSDMVRPVVLNFTTVMRICLLVGLSDKTPRSKSKVEKLQTSAGMQPLGGSFFTKSNIKEVFVALIKMRYSDIVLSSVKSLRDGFAYAEIDQELYNLMVNRESAVILECKLRELV